MRKRIGARLDRGRMASRIYCFVAEGSVTPVFAIQTAGSVPDSVYQYLRFQKRCWRPTFSQLTFPCQLDFLLKMSDGNSAALAAGRFG